jgi:hypothetical protein
MRRSTLALLHFILILSLATLACGVTISLDSEEEQPTARPTQKPAVPPTPRPTATKRPPTEEPIHAFYVGNTGSYELPVLILHSSGDRMAIAEDSATSDMTGLVFTSQDDVSLVVYTDGHGYPKSAVAGDDILLYSNYTNTSVDVTIVRSDGHREYVRADLDLERLNMIRSIGEAVDTNIAFSPGASSVPDAQDFLDYVQEGMFALDIASCVGHAAAFALTPKGLLSFVTACDGPILEEIIRERRASNLDVAGWQMAKSASDLVGCALLEVSDFNDCASLLVDAMVVVKDYADQRYANVPEEPDGRRYH